MIRRRRAQRSFGDVVLFGETLPSPESLMDPVLVRIDALLDEDSFIDAVVAAQKKRAKNSVRRGRPSTPAEVVLRMLALKRLRNWRFQTLEWEVKGNLCYRRFCRIDAGKVPDATTLVRQAQLFDESTLRALLEGTVKQAVDQRLTAGNKLRVDTTVVEANIHHPTDSGLCEDVVRVLGRQVRRLATLGVAAAKGVANVSRSVGRRMREIAQAVRLRGDAAKESMKKPYRRLLRITKRMIKTSRRVARGAKCSLRKLANTEQRRAARALAAIKHVLPLADQVVRQTQARVVRGEPASAGKILSIFAPGAQILRRGKPHKPTEFGTLVKVQEAEGGIVTDVALVPGKADAPLLVPSVQYHQRLFGRAPRLAATDRGFYSTEGERTIKQLGVKRPVIPKPGGKSKERTEHERQRWFKAGRAWRAGGEARIARLKHTFGMARCRQKGEAGLHRTIYWAALANNWAAMGRKK
jgi:transposase, IS5 family